MNILGISFGANASAAVMVDGRVISAVSEERLNRVKNFDGWPSQSIRECLRLAGLEAKDIDQVAWGEQSVYGPDLFLTHRSCRRSVADMVREQDDFWFPTLIKKQPVDYLKVFRDFIDLDQFPGRETLRPIAECPDPIQRIELFKALRDRFIEIDFGLPPEKNRYLNHHATHAAYAAFAMRHNATPLLVFTLDGSGDGENATVSVFENGRIRKLYGTGNFVVGRYYRNATLILGMKILEHEFKVMGLAPYAKPYHSDLPYQIYRNTIRVDGLDVGFNELPGDSYFYFKDKLKAARFDGIAGGIQRFTEDVVCEWIANWMSHTGIPDIALSGGVSMNIKMNYEIARRLKPRSLLVPGSGSDESLAIGACYKAAVDAGERVEPLSGLYLGTQVDRQEASKAIQKLHGDERFQIIDGASEADYAAQIAAGKVLGRCKGRMEFGARALGNRSINADPRNFDTVRIINDKIKSRDFWMPFAPTIMQERMNRYLSVMPGVNYSQMTIGAESTDEGRRQLRAALHPADFSARPQSLAADENPHYHAMIAEFESRCGVGGILNTSLNIHGLPIVRTADDAVHVLTETDIDGILIEDFLVLKNQKSAA